VKIVVDYDKGFVPPAAVFPGAIAPPMEPHNHRSVDFQLDTGADVTCVPIQEIKALTPSTPLFYKKCRAQGFNGAIVNSYQYRLKVTIDNQANGDLFVLGLNDLDVGLLGRDFIKAWKVRLLGPTEKGELHD
jgi:hypothetical protein